MSNQNMIDISKREPYDDLTPEEVIAAEVEAWMEGSQSNCPVRPLSEVIIEALVYKAYFEQAEGALRWLDPWTDEGSYVLDRIGVTRP